MASSTATAPRPAALVHDVVLDGSRAAGKVPGNGRQPRSHGGGRPEQTVHRDCSNHLVVVGVESFQLSAPGNQPQQKARPGGQHQQGAGQAASSVPAMRPSPPTVVKPPPASGCDE
jgi:hypothetical protein